MASHVLARGHLFLQPSDMAITEGPATVRTVLGSCVAIIMRSPRLGVAAIAHCLLPNAPASVVPLARQEALKYVDSTVELMLVELSRRGATAVELEVKLFGGADSMDRAPSRSAYQVGRRNVEAALAMLAARGLAPAARSVGGPRGYVIDFDGASGDVKVKRLPMGNGASGKGTL
jgi:chemotaxis receptor (MCP) glutamine deamidase CheD